MFIYLMQLFSRSNYLVGGITPQDLPLFYPDRTPPLTLTERKDICLLIDLLRLLVIEKHFSFENKTLKLFGVSHDTPNESLFLNILSEQSTRSDNALLAFIFKRISSPLKTLRLLDEIDQKIINRYLES